LDHGTPGERQLQLRQQSEARAGRFYERQMQNRLSAKMVDLLSRQTMMFVATADAEGNCDCTPRFGSAGFVHVIDERTLAYPEYRGNGVFASLGNIAENPHIGLVFVDFFDTTVGLHVNGGARSYLESELPPGVASYLAQHAPAVDAAVECWVVITVDEAYIHCSKHVPLLRRGDKRIDWGTDDPAAKSEEFFREEG